HCFFACDFQNIFTGGGSNSKEGQPDSGLGKQILLLEITGGIAGIRQTFVVDESGVLVYENRDSPGARKVVQLSTSELDDLQKLFLNNNFFSLGDNYFNGQVVDALNYAISFSRGRTSKLVRTDYFGAPANLQTIVEGLLKLTQKVTENGLQLRLQLSSSEIKVGETVAMQLTVTNTSQRALKLKFASGQTFDFVVLAETDSAGSEPAVIWNWAHDQVFIQVLRILELQPQESKSYQVEWDGHDNSGAVVSGDFIVRAELLSFPGGSPEQQTLHVGK
ncbi:MAG: BsuPI-related putative proteinase inhibitor, partial [bacterium]